jgi:hypothetical protein
MEDTPPEKMRTGDIPGVSARDPERVYSGALFYVYWH